MKTNEELEARIERLERLIANMAKDAADALNDPWTHPSEAAGRAMAALISAMQTAPDPMPAPNEEE